MDADPLTADDMAADTTAPAGAEVSSSALDAVGFDALSPEAQDLLLGLADSAASLEPTTRSKFVAAAERALQKRRDAVSPLPRLLFLARLEVGEDVGTVAKDVTVHADDLLNVECGRKALETLGPEAVVNWIQHYKVPTGQAREALLKALWIQSAGDRAAAGLGEAVIEESEFFRAVMERLQTSSET
jgi:hypothetical protein